jgi:hypothetical protein
VLAIVVGLVVLVTVVVGVLTASRDATEYDSSTPEGVVQAYVEAVLDGELEVAAGLLSEDSPCDVDNLDNSYLPEYDRVVLLDSEVDGDTARVEIEAVTVEGPFGAFDYGERHTFRLERSGTEWRITGRPWPMFECFKGD